MGDPVFDVFMLTQILIPTFHNDCKSTWLDRELSQISLQIQNK